MLYATSESQIFWDAVLCRHCLEATTKKLLRKV